MGKLKKGVRKAAEKRSANEYPWWLSREKTREFLKSPDYNGIGLPEDLKAATLKKIYERHKPREFVAYELLSVTFDHANCPRSVLREALKICLSTRIEIDACLNALALCRVLPRKDLEELADRFLGEDISDHALGALANKYILEHDEKCLDALREARARFAMPRFRHIKKWLDETIKELESDPKRNGNPRAKRRK